MEVRRNIGELTMRVASAIGASLPPNSFLAGALYRLAGRIVAMCGGTLRSRIISFVVPEALSDQPQVDRTIEALRLGLSERGIALDVRETRLSREAALESEDVRRLVADGAEWMTFYELFVPTHYYGKASGLAETILGELRRSEDAG